MVIHHIEVGRRVTRWTAEDQAQADMGESNLAEMESPFGVWKGVLFLRCCCQFRRPLVPWLLSHTPLNTHSLALLCSRVHNAIGD